MGRRRITDSEYQRLLAWRSGLRRFLQWSEQQAGSAGLTASQHQLLLAVRGHPDDRGPTVGEVAAYLALRHHSAVGLIDRVERLGLVTRDGDPDDRRLARVVLTDEGRSRLEELTAIHLDELSRVAPAIASVWRELGLVDEDLTAPPG